MNQTMRVVALTCALCLMATAQTMVGIPQQGVFLSGPPNAPFIVNENSSGKPLVGLVVRVESTGNPTAITTVWLNSRSIPADGHTHSLPLPVVNDGSGTVSIDGAVFEDGTFVGPDKSNYFDVVVMQTKAMAAIAKSLIEATDREGAWNSIRSIKAAPRTASSTKEAGAVDYATRSVSMVLLDSRTRGGEAAALALAAKFTVLANLKKVN
jgi:hypothetical protein